MAARLDDNKREDLIDQRAAGLFDREHRAGQHDNLPGYNRATDGLDDHPISAGVANGEEPNQNRQPSSARQLSESENTYKYPGKSGGGHTHQKVAGKSLLKKYGPSGGIIGLLLGGLFGMGVMLTPSLAMIHLKEVLFNDLGDQNGAMLIRSNKIWYAKMKDLSKSYSSCTIVKFRCGLRGFTDRQISSFEKAGITVELADGGEKNPVTRKTGVKSLTIPTANGSKVITNATEMRPYLLGDSVTRSAMRRAYNPIFYSMWDKTAGSTLAKLKVSKAKKLTGKTAEENDKLVQEETDKSKYTADGQSKAASDDETDDEKQLRETQNSNAGDLASEVSNSSGYTKAFSTAVHAVGIIGTVDIACTVYNLSLSVEAGAKQIRSQQLATYSMIYNTTADQMKASDPDLSPEAASYANEKLAATDNRKKVVDETSTVEGDTPKEVDNPYYGKNAFDSAGVKAAFYNDAPSLTARDQQFMVGGSMVGKLSDINNFVINALGGSPEAARQKCGIVQNPVVRGVSLVIGGFAAISSGGISAAANIAASAGFIFAIPILTGYLKDMIAGDVVGAATEGPDAGNAIFSGTSVILGQMAMVRGLQPASKASLRSYKTAVAPEVNQYIADETEAAKNTPFDVTNQYSFLGNLARKLLPTSMAVSSSTGSISQSILSIGSLVSSALIPHAKAADTFNEDRYSKCNDDDYNRIGIDADVMCNIRYSLTPTELAMETDDVYAWMYEQGYVGEDGNPPSESRYAEWLKECTQRTAPFGTPQTEEGDDTGSSCLDKNVKGGHYTLTELQHFRVFTIDRSIEQGMDDGPETDSASSSSGSGTALDEFTIPDNVITSPNGGWKLKDNTDYSSYPCPEGTEDLGVATNTGNGITLRKCRTEGAIASSILAPRILAVVRDAKAQGINLTPGSTLRTYEEQVALYNKNCSGGGCSPPTAKPGNSNHERGLAVDWQYNGKTLCFKASTCPAGSNPGYDFLIQNGAKYGFIKLRSEAWHWSMNGS